MENHIDITKLKKNTKILLETQATVFEILVLEPKKSKIIVHGGTKFLRPKEATLQKTKKAESEPDEFVIEKGCSMLFLYEEKETVNKLITSKVVSANIYGVDDSWTYEAIKK